ncbi:MAG TPA: SAF domain-containing protein [Actinomycetes bacterium]
MSPGGRRTVAASLRRAVARHRRLLAAGLAAGSVAAALSVLAPAPAPTADVVVAARDLGPGAALTTEDLLVQALPEAAEPAALVGAAAAGAVRRGEPLTDVRLVGAGLLGDAAGLVAAPVRLADDGVSALLRAGDVVDVLAASAPDPVGQAMTEPTGPAPVRPVLSRVVAAAARVLAVPSTRGVGEGTLVLLAVAPRAANDLAAAAVSARLSVVLIPRR